MLRVQTGMESHDDSRDLRDYAGSGSESAFAQIVRRHASMVHGVALRGTGDRSVAEEVTQTVFTILARKASLISHQELAGWLHRTACAEARNAWRKEKRRRQAMARLSATAVDGTGNQDPLWREIRPHLDELVSGLSPADRQLVVMRYFSQLGYLEISRTTGRSQPAIRKQMERALDRLGRLLRSRGVNTSGAALALSLSSQTLAIPPAAAAASISTAALATAPALGGSIALSHTFFLMTTQTILKTAGVTLLLAAMPAAWLLHRNHQLAAEVAALKHTAAPRPPAPPRLAAGNRTMRARAADPATRGSYQSGQGKEWIATMERQSIDEDSQIETLFGIMQELALLGEADLEELCQDAGTLLELYNSHDPAVRATFNGNNMIEQIYTLALYRMAKLDPDRALAAMENLKGTGKRDEVERAVYRNLARTDLAATLARLEQLEGKAAENARAGILPILSETDPDAALAMARNHTGGDTDREWMTLLIRISSEQPDLALQRAGEAIASGMNPQILAGLIDRATLDNRTRIMDWAEAYSGPNASGVRAFIIGDISHRDPQTALSLYTERQSELTPPQREQLTQMLIHNLVEKAPASAARWISTMEPGDTQQSATRRLAGRWAHTEPAATVAWITGMPDGEMRTVAVQQAATTVTDSLPEEALRLATSLSDPEKRQQLAREVLERWEKKDPEAASAARQQHGW